MAEPRIDVRNGLASDAEQVSYLLGQTWAQTYGDILSAGQLTEVAKTWHSVESLTRQIDDENTCFLVCVNDGAVVGHACAHMKTKDVLWLSKLYILPEAQGIGMGQLLFDEICRRHPQARAVQLEVGQENSGAFAFYQRNKFEKIGDVDKCGGQFDIPAIVMELDISK